MKTLDEVLEAMTNEICLSTKADCWEVPVDLYGVIVHYLHEYRSDKLQWEVDRKLWVNKQEQVGEARQKYIDKLKELEIGTLNDPLTWDELKQMEGKPVWVEALLYKKWAVIGYVGENYIRFEGVNLYAPESRTYMGAEDGWQAYRKERSSAG